MPTWSPEDQQRVARDLAHFFNAIASAQHRPPQAVGIDNQNQWMSRVVRDLSTEFATLVDFYAEEAKLGHVVRGNMLGSVELAAVEMVKDINNRGVKDKVVPVLYDVMARVAAANKIVL